MKPLNHPNTHHIEAAQGWLGLGNHIEANAELEKITPDLQGHPDVLELRWQINAKAGNWDQCVDIANGIVLSDFSRLFGWVHRSFALHELGRTQEALEHLETASGMFPVNWLIRYNMACYACCLGRKREARQWLADAIALGDAKGIKTMAREDPDLKPLWAEI